MLILRSKHRLGNVMKLLLYVWRLVVSFFSYRIGYKPQILPFILQYNKTKTHFTMGDKVESFAGNIGRVIMVYRDEKTNTPVGCAVRWDREVFEGAEISTFLPSADLGKRFNPVIRKKA